MSEGASLGDFKSIMNDLQPTVIIAPHLDDAALSVGSAILAGSLGKRPHIVVVFSISNYTLETPGTGDVEAVTRTRRNEETTAGRVMKASVEFLDYGEPLVRGACSDFGDLFNRDFDPTTDPLYRQLVDEIRKIKEGLQPKLMIFPLSLGNHRDHILLNSIGLHLLGESETRIMFFEDLPYAGIMEQADIIEVGSSKGLKPYAVPGVDLETKLLLLKTYKSQLDEFDFELIRMYYDMRTSEHLWGL
jgi:LmbE family N-acetylglucosaminyl deacetylase